MFEIIKQYVPSNKYSIKCPYSMDPIGICVHNTANDASAKSEVNYMIGNNNQVSYHVAIDDQYAVECIPFNRSAWHAGDGGSGQGNRKYISIEICYSKSGGSKFDQAEKNAARYIAMLLKEYGWDISHVKKHQDFSGKYCPHRTLDYGWQRFLDMIGAELGNTVDTDNVVKSFKDRYQVIEWNGKRVHVYKQTDDLDIGLMSAKGAEQWKALQPIDKIDDDHVHYCKVNCNYFVMTNGSDHGQHLGVEQGFNCDNAPKEDGYIVVWIDKNNQIHWGRSKDYYLAKDDVKCAFTPFCVNLANGKDEDDYSYNFGDKRKLSNTQTCLMQCADGKYAFVVFEGKVTPYQTRNFAKEYGCTFNCCLDSGGSSQMINEGKKAVYTGRAIANVLTLYKKKNVAETPQNEPNELERLRKENKELKEKVDALIIANEGLGNKLKKAYQRINELKGE